MGAGAGVGGEAADQGSEGRTIILRKDIGFGA